jgi:hypothetical protein
MVYSPENQSRMNKRAQSIFLLLAFLLSVSLIGEGQERDNRKLARKAVSYGFVSPNNRDDLKLKDAISNLNSPEEVRLLQETRDIACRVRAKARVNKSLGNWSDGAENSMIFRIYSEEPAMRYAVASLGKNWRQKTVLYFRRQASGNARMYLISVPRKHRELNFLVRAVAKSLDDSQVSYRTLVPLTTRVMVYVVDLRNELQQQLRNAARKLHARPLAFAGTGGFIGSDTDREKAQDVFSQEIKSYESHHSLNRRCREMKPRTQTTWR